MTASAASEHHLSPGPAGSARRILDDDWEVLDGAGRAIGIIWRSPEGWRCAANITLHALPGIVDGDFDTVLHHALSTFA